jgi:hypothetical protein
MNENTFSFVTDEIRFYMEKAFQVSFGYGGALVALIAAAKLEVFKDLAPSYSTEYLLATTVLLLNVLYLALVTGCLFAILKRGYFILRQCSREESEQKLHLEWEMFFRGSDDVRVTAAFMNRHAWNIDNYYLVPILVLIAVISGFASYHSWKAGTSTDAHVITAVLIVLHVIPAASLYFTHQLDVLCRQTIAAQPVMAARVRPKLDSDAIDAG